MESFAFVPTEVFDHTKVAMYLPIRKAKRHRIATASKQFEYYGVVGIVGGDSRTVEARHELFDLLENSIPNSGETITAKITNGRLYAVAVGDNRLLLANTEKAQTNEDIVYRILSIVESTGIDIEQATLKISTDGNATLRNLLDRYIKTVELP
jgi:pre-mRNA-processing ATP-dependent RNA helicase prp5